MFQNLINREENEIYFSKSHKSRREREFSLKILIIENRKRNENSIFSSEREREWSVFLKISRDSRLWLMPASLFPSQNLIQTLLPWKECPVRLSPEWRERSMTALLGDKLRLSIGSEYEEPGMILCC